MALPNLLTKAFRAHGQLCASRPWEVIIGTLMLAMFVMLMSVFAGSSNKICGWNVECEQQRSVDEEVSIQLYKFQNYN